MSDNNQSDRELLQAIFTMVGKNSEELRSLSGRVDSLSERFDQNAENLQNLTTEMREGFAKVDEEFAEAKKERAQILEYVATVDETTHRSHKDLEKRVVELEKLHN